MFPDGRLGTGLLGGVDDVGFPALEEGVEVIGALGDEPVAVRSGSIMAAAYHPELTDDDRLHQRRRAGVYPESVALVERLPDVEAVIVTDRNEVLISSGLKDRVTLIGQPTDAP